MSGAPMTVGELVAALADLDPALPVQLEGCDCIGSLGGVTVEGGNAREEPYALLRLADE